MAAWGVTAWFLYDARRAQGEWSHTHAHTHTIHSKSDTYGPPFSLHAPHSHRRILLSHKHMAASSIPMLTMTSPVLPPHPSSLPSNSAVRVSEWVWSQRRFFHHAAVPSLVSLSELRTSFMDQKALDHSAPLLRLLRYDTIFHVEFHKTACVILNNVMRIYFPAALEHFDSAVDRYGIGVYHSDKDTDWYWISWQEKLVALWLVMLMHGIRLRG
jgi:hypothetical protein